MEFSASSSPMNREMIGEFSERTGPALNQQDMAILNPPKKVTTPRKMLTLAEKIKVIEACEATGKSQRLLAAEFGISKTQVMEILRKKDSIRMVLSENLRHPDSKRLRLVKTRLEAMKESATAAKTTAPTSPARQSLTTFDAGHLERQPPTFDPSQSSGASNTTGESKLFIRDVKSLRDICPDEAFLKGENCQGHENMISDGTQNKHSVGNDFMDDGDQSEETVMISFDDDNVPDESMESTRESVQNSTHDIGCDTVPHGNEEECGPGLLQTIKSEPQDMANYIEVENNHFAVDRLKPVKATTRKGEFVANVCTPMHNDRNTSKGNTFNNDMGKPDDSRHGRLSTEDKIKLIATSKGKTQSGLASEFGVGEVDVFEILRDRDEIELEYRLECIRRQDTWQRQLDQHWRAKMQPFYNNFHIDCVSQGSRTQKSHDAVADNMPAADSGAAGSDLKEKRKRKSISLEDKMLILQCKGSRSLRETADAFGIGKTTVLDIFRRGDEITNAFHDESLNPQRKKMRSWKNTEINYEMVDIAVFEWYKKVKATPEAVFLSGPKVQKKAALLAQELGISSFKASNGWLSGFCKRHRISFKSKRRKVSQDGSTANLTHTYADSANDTVSGRSPEPSGCLVGSNMYKSPAALSPSQIKEEASTSSELQIGDTNERLCGTIQVKREPPHDYDDETDASRSDSEESSNLGPS